MSSSSNRETKTFEEKNQSEFRISTNVKPIFYKTKSSIERLNKPKQVYQPTKPFLQPDFRGLLNADYVDALKNC